MERQPQGIQSVEIAFRVIGSFLEAGRPLALGDAAQRLGMAKSKLHKYLVSLVRVGVLRQGPEDVRYELGPKLLQLGIGMLSAIDVVPLCEQELHGLRSETGQSAGLALWTADGPLFVRYLRSSRPVSVEIQIGFYAPITGSAVGRCFAAHLSETAYTVLLEREQAEKEFDMELFRHELELVRNKGYSLRDFPDTRVPGSKAVACPVFDGMGQIAASIVLVGFDEDDTLAPDGREVSLLKDAVSRVSAKLGYRPLDHHV